MASRTLRVILNGKKAALPRVRQAVHAARDQGHDVDVRVTWERGDAARLAAEALDDRVDVIVAGGGDGTVNEVVNGIMRATESPQAAMAVMPLGSANDFARGCSVPVGDPAKALELAATGEPTPIDVARVNDRFFLNAVVAGFGAEVTFNTPERLKKAIGGAAYELTGALMALKQNPYRAKIRWEGGERDEVFLFAAVGNGLQAGGFMLSRDGMIDDGLLDTLSVVDFSLSRIASIVETLHEPGKSIEGLIHYDRHAWFDVEAENEIPISPDGEQMRGTRFHFDVLHRRLPFILPAGSAGLSPRHE